MRKFQCLLFVLKRSYVSYYIICVSVSLKLRGRRVASEASTPHIEGEQAHLGSFELIQIYLDTFKLFRAHLGSFELIYVHFYSCITGKILFRLNHIRKMHTSMKSGSSFGERSWASSSTQRDLPFSLTSLLSINSIRVCVS